MVQVTDWPVLRSVTVMTVPKGRLGVAQVPAGAWYHEAWPVSEWEAAGAGAGAVVVVAGAARTTTTGRVVVVVGRGTVVVVEVVVVEVVVVVTAKSTGTTSDTAHEGSVVVLCGAAWRRADAWRPATGAPVVVLADACEDARLGVLNRRSGASNTAAMQQSRTSGRAPPALCVRSAPPFPCGPERDCVGINSEAMRQRTRGQLGGGSVHAAMKHRAIGSGTQRKISYNTWHCDHNRPMHGPVDSFEPPQVMVPFALDVACALS
jgi:hypothetical protein